MKNITPAKFRCGLGQCPGAYRSDDGFTAIRGAGNYTNFQGELPPAGEYETYIVLPVGFLEDMFEEWLQNREMAKE